MFAKALQFIQSGMLTAFPNTKVLLNWAEGKKIPFPYLVLRLADFSKQNYTEKFLGSKDDKRIYSIGEWRGQVVCTYFAKTQTDLTAFLDDWNKYFFVDTQIAERTKVFSFGTESWERLSFYYDEFSLSRGKNSRRIDFECRIVMDDLIERTLPLITQPQIENKGISEKTRLIEDLTLPVGGSE